MGRPMVVPARVAGTTLCRKCLILLGLAKVPRPVHAVPPKADMCGAARDVRFGPIADIWLSLDHLVGEQQERLGKREAERLGRLKIDDEFKLDWRLHWQIARRLAFEDAINI